MAKFTWIDHTAESWPRPNEENQFLFVEDAGHGYLKVPKRHLEHLGIEEQITEYSYQSKNYAYLEEDCDANTFITAMERHLNQEIELQIVTVYRAACRRYETYAPEPKNLEIAEVQVA